MIKNNVLTTCFVITAMLCLCGAASAQQAQVLYIASISKAPLTTPEGTGMVDEITKEMFRRIGINAEIVPVATAGALEKLAKGLYDGDPLQIAGLSEKFPDLIQSPEPTMNYEFAVFTKTVTEPIKGWEGLKPYRVVVPKGWAITDKNVTENSCKSVMRITSHFEMFNALAKNEADVVIFERMCGYEIIRQGGLKDIRVLDPPIDIQNCYLYMYKTHADLVPKAAAALKSMKDDGTYKKIVDKTLNAYSDVFKK